MLKERNEDCLVNQALQNEEEGKMFFCKKAYIKNSVVLKQITVSAGAMTALTTSLSRRMNVGEKAGTTNKLGSMNPIYFERKFCSRLGGGYRTECFLSFFFGIGITDREASRFLFFGVMIPLVSGWWVSLQ